MSPISNDDGDEDEHASKRSKAGKRTARQRMFAPALRALRSALARITTQCLFLSQGSGRTVEGTQQARQLSAGHGSCQQAMRSGHESGHTGTNTSAQRHSIASSPIALPATAAPALPEPQPLSAPPSPLSAETFELALEIGDLLEADAISPSTGDAIRPTTGPNTPFWRTPPQDIAITDTALTAEILVVLFCDFMELL